MTTEDLQVCPIIQVLIISRVFLSQIPHRWKEQPSSGSPPRLSVTLVSLSVTGPAGPEDDPAERGPAEGAGLHRESKPLIHALLHSGRVNIMSTWPLSHDAVAGGARSYRSPPCVLLITRHICLHSLRPHKHGDRCLPRLFSHTHRRPLSPAPPSGRSAICCALSSVPQ